MIDEKMLEEAKESIMNGDADKSAELAQAGLDKGVDPGEFIEKGFVPGIMEIGDQFESGEVFLPEVMMAADAMKAASDILNAAIEASGEKHGDAPKVILATVEADLHDIGKGIVASLMVANGFEVVDLGRDIPTEDIINAAIENDADVIGTSTLLTTTMVHQEEVEEELKKKNLKGKIKTIVGGAPVTIRWQDRIGADGFGENASESVKLVNGWKGK
ncbi:MAG: methyltransferase cognate corrinoid protein [Eubacteriaceae bacterium]|nr:methyltransferase cognate corrinoid protein [Eubacteriaceae bacterium]